MADPLDIVVTCTDRKSMPVPEHLRVRAVNPRPDGSPDISDWRRRLDEAGLLKRPARGLYQGETWTASLELERAAQLARGRDNVRLWVISAGYGLVAAEEPLAPYSATFSKPSRDFVGGRATGFEATERAQRWWHDLCLRPRRAPTSLTDAATRSKGDVIFVISSAYVRACRADIARAAAVHDRILVVSPAANGSLRLGDAAPPFDARLLTTARDRVRGITRPITRGTRMSLSTRVARLVVDHFGDAPFNRAEAWEHLRLLTETQPPLPDFAGDQHDDTSVRDFIRAAIQVEPSATKTRLLRTFREAGNKCEQKRFGRLFQGVQEELVAKGSG